MSDYSRVHDFSAKDALSSGDAAKLIKGSEVDAELDAVVTAISTKLDGTVTVASGGTGATSLTDGGLLLGSGTGVVTALAVLTKGAIVAGDGATDPQALSVGSNDQVLTADSAQTLGVKWATAATGFDTTTLSSTVTTTGGTAISFTSLPDGIKQITLMLTGFSTSGTDDQIVQIGDSGGYHTSGYVGTFTNNQASVKGNHSSGFVIICDAAAANAWNGQIVLKKQSATQWEALSMTCREDSDDMNFAVGRVTLDSALDRIQWNTVGSDTCDANAGVSIQYT